MDYKSQQIVLDTSIVQYEHVICRCLGYERLDSNINIFNIKYYLEPINDTIQALSIYWNMKYPEDYNIIYLGDFDYVETYLYINNKLVFILNKRSTSKKIKYNDTAIINESNILYCDTYQKKLKSEFIEFIEYRLKSVYKFDKYIN